MKNICIVVLGGFAAFVIIVAGASLVDSQEPPLPEHPECGILVQHIALDERIVVIQGQCKNACVNATRNRLLVRVHYKESTIRAAVKTAGLKKLSIQNVTLTDIKSMADGNQFMDAYGHMYVRESGPKLQGAGPLTGSMQWTGGELRFVEPSVGQLTVIRSWKRVPRAS